MAVSTYDNGCMEIILTNHISHMSAHHVQSGVTSAAAVFNQA